MLIQLYFEANKWWSPPEEAGDDDTVGTGAEPEFWDSGLPDMTE